MSRNCELPFTEPTESKYNKSLKNIAEEIKNGTTNEYKELSDEYKLITSITNKQNEKVS